MNAWAWIEQLRPNLSSLDAAGWAALEDFDTALTEQCPTGPPATDQAAWSGWLLDLRRRLAAADHRAPAGPAGPVWQTLAQFLAGFRDLDLRDCTGPGHGAMVLAHGTRATVQRWQARLAGGDLIGIAATERHGGSRITEITTRATLDAGDRWRLTGEKCWVSRLDNAAAFVTFVRDPDGAISAVLVDGDDPRLERDLIDPAGLAGWGWGVLRLHGVPVDPAAALIGRPGDGLAVFHRHFARFRPLVTATALGTAAGVHHLVVDALAARTRAGVLPRVRDNALITLGRTHAEISAALLAALAATRLANVGHPGADLASRVGKAAGVDSAVRAVADLAPLIGACGFQQHHPVAKARADLAGLLYADGIHDSLYRSGGLTLLAAAVGPPVRPTAPALAVAA